MSRPMKDRNATRTKELLRRLAREARGGVIDVGRAADVLEISRRTAANRLAHLARKGWITRARRGLYLVLPLEAEAGSEAGIEDPWVLASELFSPCYVGGWSAAEHWGFTEQLFRETFVVSAAPVRQSAQSILGVRFRIAKVRPERLEGAIPVWRGPERVSVSDRERTIVDALRSPHWVGGVRHLAEIMTAYGRSRDFDPGALIACARAQKTGVIYKRLGYLAECLWPEAADIVATAHNKRSKGNVKLDPAVASRGRLHKRWGLWINVQIPQTDAL